MVGSVQRGGQLFVLVLQEAIEDAAERIEAGELPDITAPVYETAPPKRQSQPLRAVRAAG